MSPTTQQGPKLVPPSECNVSACAGITVPSVTADSGSRARASSFCMGGWVGEKLAVSNAHLSSEVALVSFMVRQPHLFTHPCHPTKDNNLTPPNVAITSPCTPECGYHPSPFSNHHRRQSCHIAYPATIPSITFVTPPALPSLTLVTPPQPPSHTCISPLRIQSVPFLSPPLIPFLTLVTPQRIPSPRTQKPQPPLTHDIHGWPYRRITKSPAKTCANNKP